VGPTQLTALVPSGASTGAITVTTGASLATSASQFVVIGNPAPPANPAPPPPVNPPPPPAVHPPPPPAGAAEPTPAEGPEEVHHGRSGYWLVAADGGVFAFGDAAFHGSLGGVDLPSPAVAVVSAPSGKCYWMVTADGPVFPFGGATSQGSMAGRGLSAPIVGMASTPSGQGYWLLGKDGGIFSFGDAAFHGSTGNI